MKKTIILVLVLILATLCLTSCQDGKYTEFNQAFQQSHAQLTIDVTVKKSGETNGLVSNVVVLTADGTKQVSYTLQQYATIDVNGDQITLPESQIITKTGNVVLENGQVTSQTGDQVDLDFANLGTLDFNFSDSCLFNPQTTNGIFTAHVTSLTKFCGQNISGATNVKVSVDTQTFKMLTLTYTANGSDVTIVYTIG